MHSLHAGFAHESPPGLRGAIPTPASQQRLGSWMRLALILAIAGALLAPIWTVRYVPLVDYPNHLASAFVLAHLKDPSYHFSQFYSSDWNTYPYLMMDWILVSLERFLPIDLVGRLLLSLCVLGLPAAAWFFVRHANPGEDGLALWSLVITENLYFFLYGFLNMQLSLALCLVVLGLWLRYLERPCLASWFVLLFLTTALYFTHLMGFGVAGIVMTAYALFAGKRLREILLSWALFIPGIVFVLHSHARPEPAWAVLSRGFGAKVAGLLVAVLGWSPALDFLTLAALVGALAFAWAGNPQFVWNRRWLGVLACLFVLYWIFPAGYGAGMNADRRLLPFLFVLGLATARVGSRRRQLAVIAILLFALRAGALEHHFVSLQPHLEQMSRSFSVIPQDARVLPLVPWAQGKPIVERHFWAYGVIERGWFSPCLFHDPGVQPFQLKLDTYNPYQPASCGDLKSVDWERVRTDYQYAWAYDVPQYSAALSAIGTPIFEEARLRVYRLGKSASRP
jgi:hypothetical protein